MSLQQATENKCGIHSVVLKHSCKELAKSVVTNNLSLYKYHKHYYECIPEYA